MLEVLSTDIYIFNIYVTRIYNQLHSNVVLRTITKLLTRYLDRSGDICQLIPTVILYYIVYHIGGFIVGASPHYLTNQSNNQSRSTLLNNSLLYYRNDQLCPFEADGFNQISSHSTAAQAETRWWSSQSLYSTQVGPGMKISTAAPSQIFYISKYLIDWRLWGLRSKFAFQYLGAKVHRRLPPLTILTLYLLISFLAIHCSGINI